MQAIRINDDFPLTPGEKKPKALTPGEAMAAFEADTQAAFRELFETLDWGSMQGIRERDCQQKAILLADCTFDFVLF